MNVSSFLAFIGLPLSVLLSSRQSKVTRLFSAINGCRPYPCSDTVALRRIQIILSSSGSIFQWRRYTKFVCVRECFIPRSTWRGILLGIFHFGTLTSGQLHCGDIHHHPYSVGWQMYRVTFRQSAQPVHPSAYSPVGD